MAKVYVEIGEDADGVVNIKDSAGSNDDLSGYEGYGAVFYYKFSGTVVKQFSKNVVSGWNDTDITTTDEANGNFTCHFQRADTEAGYADRDVWCQPVIQETDTNHTSNQFRDLVPAFYAFTFRTGGITSTDDMS